MGRRAQGWLNDARGVWCARLGAISEWTGKPRRIVLKVEQGRPIAKGGTKGRDAAIRRLVEARDRPKTPAVDEVYRAYLAWQKGQGSSDATIMTHWLHLTRFCTFVHDGVRYGTRPAETIVPKDLGRIKASGKGPSATPT